MCKERSDEALRICRRLVANTVLVLVAGLLGSFGLLLLSINRKYLVTFYDTRTGSQYITDRFYNGACDEVKFEILTMNEATWSHIRGDVKTWLEEKLPGWLEEQPPFLTDYNKSVIPEWAVDNKALLSRIRNENVEALLSERRRSSVAGLIEALPNA